MKYLSLAAFALLLFGCSDTVGGTAFVSGASAQTGADRAPEAAHGVRPKGAFRPDTHAMSEDERKKHFTRRRAVRRAIREATREAETWIEADAAMQLAVSDLDGLPAYIYETLAATTMLNLYLAPGPGTPEAIEATERWTQMLLRNETPNAALMRRALAELDGVWTDAEQSQAAEATLAAAERYAAWQSECVDCGSNELRLAVEASGSERAMTYLYDAERLVRAYAK